MRSTALLQKVWWQVWLATGLLLAGLMLGTPPARADDTSARNLFQQGEQLRSQGRLTDAAAAYEKALDLLTRARHPKRYAVMARLGTLRMDQRRFAEGEKLLGEAVNGLYANGDDVMLTNTLVAVGDLHIRLGDAAAALQTYQWVIDLGHERKNDRILAAGHNGAALAHRKGGKPDRAAASYDQAFAAARRAGDRLVMAQVQSGQAGLILDQGNRPEACRRFARIRQTFRDINQPQWAANTQREMNKAGCG